MERIIQTRLVGGFDELGDSICPRVRFLDEDHACAFADDQVAFSLWKM